jgi:Transglutaminase-like superfamily
MYNVNYLPGVKNKIKIFNTDGYNSDIIKAIIKSTPRAREITRELSKHLCAPTAYQTAKNIFDFLMNYVEYKKDNGAQVIKHLNALIKYGGDCKSYALATVAILQNCGFPAYYRFTSYSDVNIPTHVYAYTLDATGTPVIIDAVYKRFNAEKLYNYKKDYKMKILSIEGLETFESFAEKMKVANTEVGKLNLKKSFKGFKKIALSVPRNAFLTLIRINARGLANKINRGNIAQIKAMWQKLGGNVDTLQNTINAGAKLKPFLGSKHSAIKGTDEMGVVGAASIATVLAAAAPIIAVVSKYLAPGDKSEGTTDDIIKESGAHNVNPDDVLKSATNEPHGKSGGFLSSIPMPVKLLGGAGLAYLAIKMIKK